MITSMSKFVSHFLCKHDIINSDDIDIYQYGFEIIISTAIGFTLIILIGTILNMLPLSLIFYIIFVSLRKFTGGYHAKSYFKCNLVFVSIYLFTIFMTKITIISEQYNFFVNTLLLVVVSLTVWRYAPIENPNKPLDEEQRKINHKYSIISTAILSAVSCGLYFYFPQVAVVIAYTLGSVAMLIWVSIIGGELNE